MPSRDFGSAVKVAVGFDAFLAVRSDAWRGILDHADLDLRPFGLDLVAQVPAADPHSTGQGEKIDPMIVAIRDDQP
jgi:hypothetical protein